MSKNGASVFEPVPWESIVAIELYSAGEWHNLGEFAESEAA